jgi:hypothetical protein
VATVSTVIAAVVTGTVVAAVVAGLDAPVTAVVAGLDAPVTAVVAGLGLALAALHLRRRQGAVGCNSLDLDALTLVQRAEPGDAVKARLGRDLHGCQALPMLAVTDRERACDAIDRDDRAFDVA